MVHTGGSRRRGKPRSRILYWFRTPPGVRVGRSALDEDAIRLIEEHNPDVEFDWTRILKGQEGERRVKERPPRTSTPVQATAPPASAVLEPDVEENDEEEPLDQLESATIQHPATTVAEAKLGPEGLARLRARHAEILARISEGIADPVRKDELKAQAERLNPDTWVTEDEVAAGLESYETVFESLRTAVGRRRKRRRSRRPRLGQAPSGAPTDHNSDEDDTPDPEAG